MATFSFISHFCFINVKTTSLEMTKCIQPICPQLALLLPCIGFLNFLKFQVMFILPILLFKFYFIDLREYSMSRHLNYKLIMK